MLATAEQLAAGLGASVVKGGGGAKIRESQVIGQGGGGGGEKVKLGSTGDGVGNAHLRLWIGERSLGESVFWFSFFFFLPLFLFIDLNR